jgi:hypothetical protein
VLTLRSPAGSPAEHSQDPAVRTFVSKIETILTQSGAARRSIGNVLSHGFSCEIPLSLAHERMSKVVDARRKVLARVSRIAAVPSEAEKIRTLLETAINDSIEADILYQNGFRDATGCTPPDMAPPKSEYFKGAARADARATSAKTRFVTAFNPLARRFGLKSDWSAGQI